ncbi:11964_t:CDS:2 [Rhizophagus irregularis]|nr:11964_t:CDS:2 [Rhizophagus irregularis]
MGLGAAPNLDSSTKSTNGPGHLKEQVDAMIRGVTATLLSWQPNLDSSTKVKAEIRSLKTIERSALMTFGVASLSFPRFPSSRAERI